MPWSRETPCIFPSLSFRIFVPLPNAGDVFMTQSVLSILWTLLAGSESNSELLNDNFKVYHAHVNYMEQSLRRCIPWVVVHFNRLINPLEHEGNQWIRYRPSYSHLPTQINLPEICLTVILPFYSLFSNRFPYENYLCIPHFSSPYFQLIIESYFPYHQQYQVT